MKTLLMHLKEAAMLLALCAPMICGATNYYVSTSGNNSNNGLSTGNAFKTVEYGVRQLSAGDTLFIMPGTYTETQIDVIPTGNSSSPIVIIAHDMDDRPVIQSSSTSVINYIFMFRGRIPDVNNTANDVRSNQEYVTLEGLILDGTRTGYCDNYGLVWIGEDNSDPAVYNQRAHARNITIKDCELKNPSRFAVLVRSSSYDNLFEDLAVHGMTYDSTCAHLSCDSAGLTGGDCDTDPPIYFHWESSHLNAFYIAGLGNTIRNCNVYDLDHIGVSFFNPNTIDAPSTDSTPNLVEKSKFKDIAHEAIHLEHGDTHLVKNNIFMEMPNVGVAVINGTAHNKIYNNTFYECHLGVNVSSSAGSSNSISNNIFDYGGSTNPNSRGIGSYKASTITYNLFRNYPGAFVGTHTTNSNSVYTIHNLFYDVPNEDFRLRQCAAALDAGTDLSPDVTDDYAGNTRSAASSAYDIGAHEGSVTVEYYVSTTGSNSNNGLSTSTPFKTIEHAIPFLSPSVTLNVMGNVTYPEEGLTNIPPGNSCGQVTIQAYSTDTPTIKTKSGNTKSVQFVGYTTNGTDWQMQEKIELKGLIIDGDSVNEAIYIAGDASDPDRYSRKIKITDCELKNADYGVRILSGGDTNTFTNLDIHDCNTDGIRIESQDNIVTQCTIYDNASEGIQTANSSADRNVISRNTFYGNTRSGVQISGGTANLIKNNVAYDNDLGGFALTSTTDSNQILNNTMEGNVYGIYHNGDNAKYTVIKNNILFNHTSKGIRILSSTNAGTGLGLDIKNNDLGGTTGINIIDYDDPNGPAIDTSNHTGTSQSFVNLTNHDFTLQTGSDAVNTGLDLSPDVTVDFVGNSRGYSSTNYDRGAFECQCASKKGFDKGDNTSRASLPVFPNPFSENITINADELEDFEVTVYNTTGQLIYKQQHSALEDGHVYISTSEWARGIYSISILKNGVILKTSKVSKVY